MSYCGIAVLVNAHVFTQTKNKGRRDRKWRFSKTETFSGGMAAEVSGNIELLDHPSRKVVSPLHLRHLRPFTLFRSLDASHSYSTRDFHGVADRYRASTHSVA